MFKVPGETYEAQINCCLDCITSVNIISEKYKPVGIRFFVTITINGFCKFGIIVPIANYEFRNAIIECETKVNSRDFFDKLCNETIIHALYARLYWVVPHYGYGVYAEGFQIAIDFDFGV